MTACVSLKVANNDSLASRKTSKMNIFDCYYSKTKTEKCNQSNLCCSDDFGRLIPCTTTHFLELSEFVSPKVTTNGSFKGKQISKINIFEAIILNQYEGVRPKQFMFF